MLILIGIFSQAVGGVAVTVAAPIIAVVLGQIVMGIWTLAKLHSGGKETARRLESMDNHLLEHCDELKQISLAVNTLNIKLENQEKLVKEYKDHQEDYVKEVRTHTHA